ncbi:MAG: hypothetical protein L0H23_01125 [Luteimonas sp.]|nr:hypothetical protein [Luteimonas sp.]
MSRQPIVDTIPGSLVTTPLYAAPPAGFRPLRVVLLLPQAAPAWLLQFAELAASSRWIAPILLPVADARSPSVASVAVDVQVHLALERIRRRHRDDAGTLDETVVGDSGPMLPLPVLETGASVEELRARVQALRPDVILLLGQEGWADVLADCAESGCWILDAGLVDAVHGGLDLLAPMLEHDGATVFSLELLYPDGQVRKLEASRGSTQHHSFVEQRELAMRKLPALLMRSLRKLAAGEVGVPGHQVMRLRLTPRPRVFASGLRAFAIAAAHFVRRRLDRLRGMGQGEPWRLVLRRATVPLDPAAPVIGAYTTLRPPPGSAWADPCLVEDGRRRLLFVEEFPQDMGGKGIIICLQVREDGTADRLGVVLDEPFHLSYPQPFRWQGEWYMTVESGAARRASLYRAEAFPLRWTRVADLIQGRACVDPTLHRHNGRWYLFANVSESGGSTCDELFLFVADDLAGPFQPHPDNPIVSDVRHARPAGRLFEHRGRLVRPAQNCGPSYGAEVAFREVTVLSPTRYEERPLGRLSGWGLGMDGCHTYSAIDGLEVLDVRDRSPSEHA